MKTYELAPKIRILFADDEPAIRITLGAILQQEGFEVTLAATVPEALGYINQNAYDVLLADLNIGERSDGFTLISAMRRVQPHAVTLILTGYPDFETALHAIRTQVDDYLTKPADPRHLVATIKEKVKTPRRVAPLQVKRVSQVLRENIDFITQEWLVQYNQNSDLAAIDLSERDRLDHVRQIVKELADRIETSGSAICEEPRAAHKHGRDRSRHGYTPRLIATEARLLQFVISRVLQNNLLTIDLSTLIPDLMLVGEALYEEFEESLRAFEEHADVRRIV